MRTPDRSPIKRGLSTRFEYNPDDVMKNVANLGEKKLMGTRSRTPKAAGLSKGF